MDQVNKLSVALSENTTLQRVELDWFSLTSTQISHLKSKHPMVLENSFVHTYGERPFPKACAEGRLEDVKSMVEIVMPYFDTNDLKVRKTWSGINESKSKEGKTGVYLAAFNGHADVVKYLLGKGANEEDVWELYKRKYGDTPFPTACAKGKLKDVQLMVECLPSLDINESKSKEGKTGAYLAAFHGKEDVVKYLLGKGANRQDVEDGTWGRVVGEENVPIWKQGGASLRFDGYRKKRITEYDCKFLAPDLSKMKALKGLTIFSCPIGDVGLAHLSNALPKGVAALTSEFTNISDAGVAHLSNLLPEMQALERWNIFSCLVIKSVMQV
eukprot:g5649.t1